MPSSSFAAEVSQALAFCRARAIRQKPTLRACLKGGPALLALVLMVSAAALHEESPPLSMKAPVVAPAPMDLERDGWVALFKLGNEVIETRPAPLESPLLAATESQRAGETGIWLKPSERSYLSGARVTAIDPESIEPKAGKPSRRALLSQRFETTAAPESPFAAALRRAGTQGYRERFASRAGRLSRSLTVLAARAEALAERDRASVGGTRLQPTVAEQIRRNSESMPTTRHLSDLLVTGPGAAPIAQQAAASSALSPGS